MLRLRCATMRDARFAWACRCHYFKHEPYTMPGIPWEQFSLYFLHNLQHRLIAVDGSRSVAYLALLRQDYLSEAVQARIARYLDEPDSKPSPGAHT